MARRSRKAKPAAFVVPEQPPPTEAELAASRQITAQLHALTAQLHQRNLDVAVLLAQQAARHRGPLVEHFAELGRRFGDALHEPPKPKLQVVEGGKAR